MTTSYAQFADPIASFPRGFREDARGLSFTEIRRTYSPTSGPIRLGSFEATPRGAGRHLFDATFASSDTIHSATIIALGAAEAMTSMLHDAGIHVEILSFHQQPSEAGTITFALCSSGGLTRWAMGTGATPFESTARAIVTGANRLRSAN